eukprot:scaffold534602_cov55-Attheya_sp.AAC.2
MPNWLCDVCKTASFFWFEDAVEHEKKCREKCRERQEEDEIVVWLCEKCTTATFATFEETAEHEKECQGIQGRKLIRIISKSINKSFMADKSLCEVCEATLFFTFEEALQHEEKCEGRQEDDKQVDGWSYIIL